MPVGGFFFGKVAGSYYGALLKNSVLAGVFEPFV